MWWINVVGAASSIVGLFITLFVAWSVRQLRMRFAARIRTPDLLKRLRQLSRELSSELRGWDGGDLPNETRVNLHQIEAIVRMGQRHLTSDARMAARRLARQIETLPPTPDADGIWEVYYRLQALIETLSELQKEQRSGVDA